MVAQIVSTERKTPRLLLANSWSGSDAPRRTSERRDENTHTAQAALFFLTVLAESEDMDLLVGKELQKKSQREAMRKGSEETQDGQDDHENTSREDESGGPEERDAAIE